MSAAEELVPPAPELSEEQRHRLEDPDFPAVLARARAKARGEPYNPEQHGPFEPVRKAKKAAEVVESSAGNNLQELIQRFMEKGKPRQREPGVKDIRDWRDR